MVTVDLQYLQIEELVQLSHNGQIDALVNNAGISMRGSVLETPFKRVRKVFDSSSWPYRVQRDVMEVNYFGQVAVTKALLPFIPDDGVVIVTSSLQVPELR